MSKQYFHFTLGPVQSFVGQARRTRDFWAGSFLLSWLSGIAMQSVIAQQRRLLDDKKLDDKKIIIFPHADKDFLNAITNDCDKGKSPQQGSIPNRFKAKVCADFQPQQVVDDVQTVWKKLADTIYAAEIANHALDNTQVIWNRQVESFWDMSWVLVDDIEDSSSLDRRKNWRSHYQSDEAGIKCSLMGDWQELSGIAGVRKKDREAREAFWQSIGKNNAIDFSEKEHLCAMSYIKRRFLSYFADFNVELKQFTAHGWKLPNAVPSVSYIAAAAWFAEVLKNAKDNNNDNADFIDFFSQAKTLGGLSEYNTSIAIVERASNNKQHKGLDGGVFHEHELDNPNTFPDRIQAGKTKKALKPLIEKYGAISPFYAVLMMDGDSLGKQMSDIDKQKYITKGLADFTAKVPELVYENNGFLIYAGGDDVLALVTLEDALSCALAIRQHYEDCFVKENETIRVDMPEINKERKEKNKEPVGFEKLQIKTSISAAIIYTHIGSPLKNVLHEAHELLDDVAKAKAGRNALAVRVYKGSGLALEWAKRWDKPLNDSKNCTESESQEDKKNTPFYALKDAENYVLDELITEFQKNNQEGDKQFSSKFFYKIRQRFELLYGRDEAQQQNSPLNDEQAIKLMAMEYLQSVDKKDFTMKKAKDDVKPLIEQSYNAAKGNRITVDAALLVRFLAQKGIEGGRS